MFKLVRETPIPPVIERIQFQSDNELNDLETAVATIDGPNIKYENKKIQSPVLQTKHSAKRKMNEALVEIKPTNVVIKTEEPEVRSRIVTIEEDAINISDTDSDNQLDLQNVGKKPKLDSTCEELPKVKEVTIKAERHDLEYDAFQVKQEHQNYDDDPIYIDSESEDDESVQWLMRLSQSSPGKPFVKVKESKADIHNEENSYSQMDDEDECLHDFIAIPFKPHEHPDSTVDSSNKATDVAKKVNDSDEELFNDLDLNDHSANHVPAHSTNAVKTQQDVVDVINTNYLTTDMESASTGCQQDKGKRAQMIEPLIHAPRKKTIQPVMSESKYVNINKMCHVNFDMSLAHVTCYFR